MKKQKAKANTKLEKQKCKTKAKAEEIVNLLSLWKTAFLSCQITNHWHSFLITSAKREAHRYSYFLRITLKALRLTIVKIVSRIQKPVEYLNTNI